MSKTVNLDWEDLCFKNPIISLFIFFHSKAINIIFTIRLTLREIFLIFRINIIEEYVLLKFVRANDLIELNSTNTKEIKTKIPLGDNS